MCIIHQQFLQSGRVFIYIHLIRKRCTSSLKMGNCIRNSSGQRAGKKDDRVEQREFNEVEKLKVRKDGDRVVRVKVSVTRKELEKLLRHCNKRDKEGILDAEMLIKSITDADWKPNLETIPEEYSVAC